MSVKWEAVSCIAFLWSNRLCSSKERNSYKPKSSKLPPVMGWVGGWVGGLRPVVSLGVWFHFFSAAGAGQRQLFVNLLLGSFGRFSFVFSFCFSSDSGEGACHSHFVVLLLA